MRKTIIITSIVIAFLVIGALVASYFFYFVPLAQYNDAVSYLEKGDLEKAQAIFTELGNFKDSAQHTEKFEWVESKYTFTSPYTDELYFQEFIYNKDGLLIEEKTEMGSYSSGIQKYTYDNNGRMLKRTNTLDDHDTLICTYQYNDDGQITSETQDMLYTKAIYNYTYDQKGRIIKREGSFDQSDDPIIYTYTYNDDDDLIEETFEKPVEGFKEVISYEYKNGLKTKMTTSYGDGDLVLHYEYNDKNQLVRAYYDEIIEGMMDGIPAQNTEYIYNDAGLNTKQIQQYAGAGESVTEIEHQLIYNKFPKQQIYQ